MNRIINWLSIVVLLVLVSVFSNGCSTAPHRNQFKCTPEPDHLECDLGSSINRSDD